MTLVQRESPKAAEKLAIHMTQLKETPYCELCDTIGFDMDHIPPEVFDRVSSFSKYADDEVSNDVAHARAFLRSKPY